MQPEREKGIELAAAIPKILVWVKQNHITVIAVIIVLAAVCIDFLTVQSQIKQAINQCNSYWHDTTRLRCPGMLDNVYSSDIPKINSTALRPFS